MTKKPRMEFDVVVFLVLYIVLIIMVICEHNVLDIGYLLVLTIYLIRLFLCNRRKSINK